MGTDSRFLSSCRGPRVLEDGQLCVLLEALLSPSQSLKQTTWNHQPLHKADFWYRQFLLGKQCTIWCYWQNWGEKVSMWSWFLRGHAVCLCLKHHLHGRYLILLRFKARTGPVMLWRTEKRNWTWYAKGKQRKRGKEGRSILLSTLSDGVTSYYSRVNMQCGVLCVSHQQKLKMIVTLWDFRFCNQPNAKRTGSSQPWEIRREAFHLSHASVTHTFSFQAFFNPTE